MESELSKTTGAPGSTHQTSSDFNPLSIFSSRRDTLTWDDTFANNIYNDINQNIDQLARVPKNLLKEELSRFQNMDIVTTLRTALVNHVIRVTNRTIDLTPRVRSNHHQIHNDIYLCLQILVNSNNVTDNQLLTICKTKPLNKDATAVIISNQEDMITYMIEQSIQFDEMKKHQLLLIEQQNQTNNLIKSLNSIITELVDENKALRKNVEEMKNTNTNIFKTPQFPYSTVNFTAPLPPTTNNTTPSYATISQKNIDKTPNRPNKPNENNSEISQANKTPRTHTNTSNNTNKSKQRSIMQFDSSDPNAPNTHIPKEAEFQTTKRDKQKAKQKEKKEQAAAASYVKKLGTGSGLNKLKIIPRLQRIFISRLDKSTTTQELKEYLDETLYSQKTQTGEINKIKFESFNHTIVQINSSRHIGFTFDVEFSKRDMVEQLEMWPSGAYVAISHPPRRLASALPATLNQPTTNTTTLQNQTQLSTQQQQ
jgi:hypothetical protein